MAMVDNPVSGVFCASAAAGPVFLTSVGIAHFHLALPAAVPVEAGDALRALVMVIATMPFGFVIAILPNAIGAAIMARLANRIVAARSPVAWTLVGAILGLGLVAAFQLSDMLHISFGLVATSAICARLCRSTVSWSDE